MSFSHTTILKHIIKKTKRVDDICNEDGGYKLSGGQWKRRMDENWILYMDACLMRNKELKRKYRKKNVEAKISR